MFSLRPPVAILLCAALLSAAPCHGEPSGPSADTATTLLTAEKRAELFDALDLSSPALAPVKEALAKKQDAAALHALAEHFRHRSGPRVHPELSAPYTIPDPQLAVARDAVKGRVQGGGVPPLHDYPEGKIDWLFDAPRHTPGEAPNNEWQWQLCRMAFWGSMAKAYLATHDELFARAWVGQFRSYVAQCPVPARQENGPGSPWRTLEAGIRMAEAWPMAYEVFVGDPQFTDADLALFLHSCMQHARYLKAFPTTGNWVATEMKGLYTVGALFPEFKEAAGWRAAAVEKSYAQEREQFLPDGAQFELSTGYHNVSVDSIIEIPKLAKLVGREADLPADYVARMEKAFDFNLFLMTPERTLPEFNDSWLTRVDTYLKKALDLYPARQDYRWVATDGKEGKPPAETSHAFDWAGYYAMRSGWERDANFLAFRAGPVGYGHCQQDKLETVIWAFGRQVLFSAGGGQYETSPWRTYATNTFSHNCVLVDGKPQMQPTGPDRMANVSKAPIEARWESTADHDFAAGVYDKGYGKDTDRPAVQTRRVLFVKPDLFLVADTLTPTDAGPHTYQARWQLLSTQTRLDEPTRAVATTDANLPNLAVVPLRTDGLEVRAVSGQETPEILGWRIESNPKRVPATTVLHTRKGTGPQSFLTLFVPLKAGAADPVKSVKSTGPDSQVVTLADGRSFSLAVDPNPSGSLEFTEHLPGGGKGRHVQTKADR